MRPQSLTSTLLSASRLYTTTASSTCRATLAFPPSHLLKTCAPLTTTTTTTTRPFSASPARSKLVSPQAETTASKQQIRIPTPSTPVAAMAANSATLIEAFKARRSFYQLNKELPIPKDKVTSIVQENLIQVPSSFNSQSNRVLVLYGAEHDKLWDITSEVLKPLVPAESWDATAGRNAGFKAAPAPCSSSSTPPSTAMLQFATWTTLEAEGLGANLQHYNPLIDERVAAEWGIPAHWQLTAQLVFGGKAGEAGPKDHLPLTETFKVAGA
ncbi:hypothetical protein EKO27_g7928 [Xylaria grammica]|uniref:Nitroreductase domain-containing protein n=1 Tax=Xylaria grammica TaxID=363999 RepID=A0A439CYH5_9PEZI|nr:hypothetical protein EKO27_g7928 [Xylaria grammica]